jgi:hypothetical protein
VICIGGISINLGWGSIINRGPKFLSPLNSAVGYFKPNSMCDLWHEHPPTLSASWRILKTSPIVLALLVWDSSESTRQPRLAESFNHMGIILSNIVEAFPEVPNRGQFSDLS